MSGMDRLTDETLEQLSQFSDALGICDMARELLAHRRASQAAPAPSDAANSALNEARENIANRRNACPPGPLFKAFNEAMGDIEDVRFALRRAAPTEGEA